ncbi:AAA family ATPase [Ureaplasma diversum]|uniref:Chaperone protein ClpB n=1 Tax=Ureaplasma diversum NCTC 246 TaxID=1188241 RepID=A0A084EVR8_9BACT|nr:AAA family ATPase [Ureaplasma diversum]KEZ22060.1 Chaperone protein ClpB [Ureaplasma diversum NCTC 246]
MSFKATIVDQLKIRLLNKNILIIKGNTSDFVIPKILDLNIKKPAKEDDINNKLSKQTYLDSLIDFESKDILTFNQYLMHFLYQDPNFRFNEIFLYNSNWQEDADVVHGNIRVKKIKQNQIDESETDDGYEQSSLSLSDFNVGSMNNDSVLIVERLKQLIIEKISDPYYTKRTLFILDLADLFLSEKNQGFDLTQINSIIDLLTNEISSITHSFKPSNLKLILIVKNEQMFNSILFANNREVSTLNIPTPSLVEREAFFKLRGSTFSKLITKLETQKEINTAASITNGLTFRELLQLKDFADRWPYEIKDFKELYRLCFFEKKDSEWEKINDDSLAKFTEIFNSRVKGQEHVGKKIKETLIRSNVGLQGILQSSEVANNSKPKGILFLAGPTGVGKTESVKALSEFVFKDANQIIRFDMSEYNHEESDQKLLGAPPGYVGYEAGGTLTNAVIEKPFSIVLFDEIEKAHQKIFDKFLQILEDGRLTSSKGELVDFSETFIIFTSNIGASTMPKDGTNEKIIEHFKNEVDKHFKEKLNRPEILNRIGKSNIVPFNRIVDPTIKLDIIKSKIEKIKKFLLDKKSIKLEFDDNIEHYYQFVINNSDDNMGARALIIALEDDLVSIISNAIFKQNKDIQNKLANSEKGTFVVLNIECKHNTNNGTFAFKATIKD